MLAESCAKSRNKQGESREPGRVESGIKEARVGKQEGRESGNVEPLQWLFKGWLISIRSRSRDYDLLEVRWLNSPYEKITS